MPLRPPNSARPPNKKNHSAIRMGAISADAMAQFNALREASCAPARSPAARLPSTCAANTMETMPSGRQQNSVLRMAHTRWLGT